VAVMVVVTVVIVDRRRETKASDEWSSPEPSPY